MFGKRAQAAMEYLMNYWWAILLAIIVGGALWKMGLFKLGGTLAGQASKVEAQTGAIAIQDFKVDTSGNIAVFFTNNGNTRVKIVTPGNVTLNVTGEGACTDAICSPRDTTNNATILDPGEKATCTCSISMSTNPNPGDPYTLDVTVAYEDLDTGITHTVRKTLQGKYE